MQTFLLILHYAAGPVLGAVIGYFTNWLAVKMLFRPYYPKKIGKFTLPFTPGIIPKRRQAIAKAVGNAVGEKLFTKEDMLASVKSEQTRDKVAQSAVELWHTAGGLTGEEAAALIMPASDVKALNNECADKICDRVYSAVNEMNLGDIVATEAVKVVAEKKGSLGMLSMFLTDDLVSGIATKLADGVNAYVEENGKALISGAVNKECDRLMTSKLSGITNNISDEMVKAVAIKLYDGAITTVAEKLLKDIDIASIVQKKIEEMDVKDLEKLVLSVMKKELNAIVNLGALIGFILGIVMIFI
jgi:uncharacterized membrane protein YheB (UPF0754 family)